jgi:hypothetical protein
MEQETQPINADGPPPGAILMQMLFGELMQQSIRLRSNLALPICWRSNHKPPQNSPPRPKHMINPCFGSSAHWPVQSSLRKTAIGSLS